MCAGKSIYLFSMYPENVKCIGDLPNRQIIFAASFCKITVKIPARRKIPQNIFFVNFSQDQYLYRIVANILQRLLCWSAVYIS